MICLCCGKEIKQNAHPQEVISQWHTRCIKKFFGRRELPELEVDQKQLEDMAVQTVYKGLTVPGVQKKLSLHLSEDGEKNRLTVVDYPTGYILKPQTERYQNLPEFEYTAMKMAETAGVRTVPYALLKMPEGYAYITKRIDRVMQSDGMKLLAMEDFCQLSRRMTADKYKGSYEQCIRIVKQYSSMPGLDLSETFIRIVFSYIVGNSDMHLKNFSLIETEPGNRVYRLSEAYDILPVNIVLPEDKEEMALPVNGKKRNIRRKDFLALAEKCDLSDKTAKKIIAKLCLVEGKYIDAVNASFLSEEDREALTALIKQRIQNLLF